VTDAELRALVRDTVARHLAAARHQTAGVERPAPVVPVGGASWRDHPSHQLYLTVVNADEACVIEPSVSCDHCGYCKSHGH
jgi:hypothetical protein